MLRPTPTVADEELLPKFIAFLFPFPATSSLDYFHKWYEGASEAAVALG
jgi:hypothetical protein